MEDTESVEINGVDWFLEFGAHLDFELLVARTFGVLIDGREVLLLLCCMYRAVCMKYYMYRVQQRAVVI